AFSHMLHRHGGYFGGAKLFHQRIPLRPQGGSMSDAVACDPSRRKFGCGRPVVPSLKKAINTQVIETSVRRVGHLKID
ncbi:hypothetical protein NL317_28015, partial [Klebsiella pneumoniae]|nr:hypothetical protein [Klebsiella pneumoniae]